MSQYYSKTAQCLRKDFFKVDFLKFFLFLVDLDWNRCIKERDAILAQYKAQAGQVCREGKNREWCSKIPIERVRVGFGASTRVVVDVGVDLVARRNHVFQICGPDVGGVRP